MVKKIIYIFILFLLFSCNRDKLKDRKKLNIVPFPTQCDFNNQAPYVLSENTIIYYPQGAEFEVTELQQLIEMSSNLKVQCKQLQEGNILQNAIKIECNFLADNNDAGGYFIEVSTSGVLISAKSLKGVFYAVQTLNQLQYMENGKPKIRPVTIKDNPVFQYRSIMLDCSRHFFSVRTIKKYLSLMAHYKMNVFHWHLTDDQGWRIRIDAYPKLTDVGAWRIDSAGVYGGYYTKEDVRDVVKYAQDRFITIVPEIELPGHSISAIAAYPWLSCTGEDQSVRNTWGVSNIIYCAGKDTVFGFIKAVINEVSELFPGKYIHLGGDEVLKKRWLNCDKCQLVMEKNKFDENGLQGYFIKRVEKIIVDKGKVPIGWDEIVESDTPKSAVVQSWRGQEWGVKAVSQGNKVIISPTTHCYFDYGIDVTNLRKVYEFNPIPKNISQEDMTLILGSEGLLWSEFITDENTLFKQTLPRMFALSEILWSYPEKRDYSDLLRRIKAQYSFLDSRHILYDIPSIPLTFKVIQGHHGIEVSVQKIVKNIEIKVAQNSNDFESYDGNIKVSKEMLLKAKAYRNGKHVGKMCEIHLLPHRFFGKTGRITSFYSDKYSAGGDTALTDGVLGSTDYSDGHWQGYFNEDFTIIIDLGKNERITNIGANFLQDDKVGILFPDTVQFYYTTEEDDWKLWYTTCPSKLLKSENSKILYVGKTDKPISVKYIKIIAKNSGNLPPWHGLKETPSWLFIDEIILN